MDERERKNAIFGQDPNVVAVDRVKAELGLDVPTEIVPLPSNGRVYSVNSALHGRETVEIRAMTTREEDILTSQALIKKGTVVTELIKSCLVDREIDVQEMIAGDRHALMVAIRITGYGPEYSAEVECTKCNHREEQPFRLDQLPIRRLEIEPVGIGENSFHVTLPVSKKEVCFKFLTGRDEDEMTVTRERLKKAMPGTPENIVSTRLKHSIVSIDGKNDKSLINAFVAKMPAGDSLFLRKYIEKHEPGIDMSQESVCSNCGESEVVGIPINASFFWPQA